MWIFIFGLIEIIDDKSALILLLLPKTTSTKSVLLFRFTNASKNVLAKLEYTTQSYNDFAAGDKYNEGKFDGLTVEAVISF